jgi:hypothetical protein
MQVMIGLYYHHLRVLLLVARSMMLSIFNQRTLSLHVVMFVTVLTLPTVMFRASESRLLIEMYHVDLIVGITSTSITADVESPTQSVNVGRDSITVQFLDRTITNSVPYSYDDVIASCTSASAPCSLSMPSLLTTDPLRFTLIMGGIDHDRMVSFAADVSILVGDEANVSISSSILPSYQSRYGSVDIHSLNISVTELLPWQGLYDGNDMIESLSAYDSRTVIIGGGGRNDKVIHHGWNGDVFICADFCSGITHGHY